MRVSAKARQEALDRVDARCSLCTASLLTYDVHHIHFASLGGGNEAENLMALCPSCHRSFPHHLYLPSEAQLLRDAARRWEQLVEAQRSLLKAPSWKDAAAIVLRRDVREAALAHGAYGLLMDWTDMLLGEPDEPELHVVRLRLSILAAEMASYVADKREPAPRLESMRAVANRCEVPTRELDALALVEAKLHRLLGNVDDEAEALDTCSPEMRHTAEFGFRAISFVLKTGDASLLSSVPTPTVHDDDSLTDHMAVGNIIGDRGRLMLRDENVEDAYHELVRAFRIARRTFHRRGLFVAAMRLADIALRLGEAQLAAEWWMIGDQFSSVGRHLELSREPLRRRVLTAGGPHVFSSVRRDLRSLWSAFEPIVPNTPRETAEPRSADRDRTAL